VQACAQAQAEALASVVTPALSKKTKHKQEQNQYEI
jgi:hypothetical protein